MKNRKVIYVAPLLERVHGIDVFGRTVEIKLSWADGMIGVMPVFATHNAAEAYAGPNVKIFAMGYASENGGNNEKN